MIFNKYTSLPSVPYKIISYLAQNNDNIFKALYYQGSDALSQPNLTLEQKIDMIYVDEGKEVEKNIFLKPLIGEEMIDSATQLRIYKYGISPIDNMTSVINYRFDIITGSKISLIYDEDDYPVSIHVEIANIIKRVTIFVPEMEDSYRNIEIAKESIEYAKELMYKIFANTSYKIEVYEK